MLDRHYYLLSCRSWGNDAYTLRCRIRRHPVLGKPSNTVTLRYAFQVGVQGATARHFDQRETSSS
jgi:hypothetical protein